MFGFNSGIRKNMEIRCWVKYGIWFISSVYIKVRMNVIMVRSWFEIIFISIVDSKFFFKRLYVMEVEL